MIQTGLRFHHRDARAALWQNWDVSHYFATLTLVSPIIVEIDLETGWVSVRALHNTTKVPLRTSKIHRKKLTSNPPQGEQRVIVYPRTDAECVLTSSSGLATWGEPRGDEEVGILRAMGEVVSVNRDDAQLLVRIHPNPRSRLTKSFVLGHQTNLELLDKAPEKGQGVEVEGLLKTPSKRLVITDLRQVALPPIRENAEA